MVDLGISLKNTSCCGCGSIMAKRPKMLLVLNRTLKLMALLSNESNLTIDSKFLSVSSISSIISLATFSVISLAFYNTLYGHFIYGKIVKLSIGLVFAVGRKDY